MYISYKSIHWHHLRL